MWIRAVHKDPREKRLVLVVSEQSHEENNPKLLSQCEVDAIENASVLSGKESKLTIRNQPWTLKIIHEDEFLMSLGIPCTKSLRLDGHTSNNSFDMELVTINHIKSARPSLEDLSSMTGKQLGKIHSEDVIEVFV